MSHTEFKALLKKINLKPKGVKEIVLEVSDGALHGKIDMLSEMLDGRVAIAIDSEIVRYNVQINTRTEKPIRSYQVDEQGVVSEVQSEGEQLEMDLGVARKSDPIADVPEEISREVVDEFILALLAPSFDDLPWPFYAWVARLDQGDTYLRLANEYGLSSGKIVELIDEYRSRVAPLAAKWDELRKEKAEQPKVDNDEPDVPYRVGEEDLNDDELEQRVEEDIELEDSEEQPVEHSDEGDLSDWEQSIMEGREINVVQNESTESPDPLDVEAIILTEKPSFEDIPFDFPTLLERKKSGETWMDIAKTLGIPSTKLSSAWTKYKKRIEESRGGAA
ncbi:hypothetical protein [Paenibacillus sp. PL2-23]|uniref:hypothetical protein n=1 Tax=Paenibacillus sp. PL2-23 TaxID=2100729 RepID=UPI0030F8FBE1